MNFKNANSFKAKIKNIAKEKALPPQQIQQTYLIEQVIRLISSSAYKNNFIVKGGFLIGIIIGLEKRTTMDLDVTLKNSHLSKKNINSIFSEILSQEQPGFNFKIEGIEKIRKNDEYGGYSLKLKAEFDKLKEVVFIDITTGDKITPCEINYELKSVFFDENIEILAYNIETILAEKLETIISRGEGSSRPRDRYDVYVIYQLYIEKIDLKILKSALINTCNKRLSVDKISNWNRQVEAIKSSQYQKMLWERYQKSFRYAKDLDFNESVEVISHLMRKLL